MANPTTIRKRIQAIRRAPDGSAFQTCDNCAVSIPICLADMHECETENKTTVKRFKGTNGKHKNIEKLSYLDEPRSPFMVFMEKFMSYSKDGHLFHVNEEGFETWKRMSKKEREPYVVKAEILNSVYVENLLQEVEDSTKVDEEADSAMVGKFDPAWLFMNVNVILIVSSDHMVFIDNPLTTFLNAFLEKSIIRCMKIVDVANILMIAIIVNLRASTPKRINHLLWKEVFLDIVK